MNIGGVGNAFNVNYTPMAGSRVPLSMQPAPQRPLFETLAEQRAASGRAGYYRSIDGDSVELSPPRASMSRPMAVPNPVTATVMTGRGAYPLAMSPEDMRPNAAMQNAAMPYVAMPNAATPQAMPPGAAIPLTMPNSSPAAPASADTSPKSIIPEMPGSGLLESLKPEGECQTCANRKYVDGSDDASVSYQTPTKINPSMAGAAVAAHEQEHVRNEQANAQRDGREVVSQTVTLHYDSCPECGKSYVSGGTTRTMTVGKNESPMQEAGNAQQESDGV